MKFIVAFLLVSTFTSFVSVAQLPPGARITSVSNFRIQLDVQGSWDKTLDSTKAQYTGNNQRFGPYVSSQIQAANILPYPGKIITSGEFSFKVKEDGTIDSIKTVQSLGNSKLDKVIKNIIESTSQKWRPAKMENQHKSENLKMWVSYYLVGEAKKP